MDINYLESFIKIVEAGGFQKAADELFISQSSLSKQMQSLEKELQVILFDRSKRSAQLTENGKRLYENAPAFLQHYHQLLSSISSSSQSLTLAVVPIWEYYGLTHFAIDFLAEFPHIDLKINESQNAMIPELMNSGACSMGLFRAVDPAKSNCNYLTLFEDELALVVPEKYRSKAGQRVSLKEFKHEQFIMLTKDTQLYEYSMSACEKLGFTPKIIYQGNSAETIHHLVAQGKGVAIFMKQVAIHQKNTDNLVLDFEETLKSEIILAYNKNHILNEAGRLFWRYMKKHAVL